MPDPPTIPEHIDLGGGFVLTRARRGDEQWIAAAVEQSLEHLHRWLEWATPEGMSVGAQANRLPRLEGDWDRGAEYSYLVRNGRDPRVIGAAALTRRPPRAGEGSWEIGYWIHVDWCGRGLATRAAQGLTDLAFRFADTKTVVIRCDEANLASAAIPRKLGFALKRIDKSVPKAPAETGRDLVWVLDAALRSGIVTPTAQSSSLEWPSSLEWLADAGLEPQVFEHLVVLEQELWGDASIEATLLELVRLRIAQILDAPAELDRRTQAAVDAGLDEAMIAELSMWPTSPRFDERQRAVLSWSEQWVIDPEQITDEDATRLTTALSEKECASLSTALAVFESLTRTRVALGLA